MSNETTDPSLGKAFRLAFTKDVHTAEQLHAFCTVARMMAKRLAPEELHSIATRTGIDLQNPTWHDDCHPF